MRITRCIIPKLEQLLSNDMTEIDLSEAQLAHAGWMAMTGSKKGSSIFLVYRSGSGTKKMRSFFLGASYASEAYIFQLYHWRRNWPCLNENYLNFLSMSSTVLVYAGGGLEISS